jgi:hypothetical protein
LYYTLPEAVRLFLLITNDKNNKASVLLYTKKDLRCPPVIFSKIEDRELNRFGQNQLFKTTFIHPLFLVDYPAA